MALLEEQFLLRLPTDVAERISRAVEDGDPFPNIEFTLLPEHSTCVARVVGATQRLTEREPAQAGRR